MSTSESGGEAYIAPRTRSAIAVAMPTTAVPSEGEQARSSVNALTVGKLEPQDSGAIPQPKICGICNDREAKYKCVRCNMPYCSVACSTLHRADHPTTGEYEVKVESEQEPQLGPPPTALAPAPTSTSNGLSVKPLPGTTAAAGSRNAFTVLESSQELQTLFMMYPRLKSQLRDIYASTLPPTDDSMQTPQPHHEDQYQSYRGRGGRGRGGKGGRSGRHQGPWNADQGTQNGIDAISDAKMVYGKGGEGMREYTSLVMKLVAMEGIDVTQLVQDEVAEENAKIIAQLLNGDSY